MISPKQQNNVNRKNLMASETGKPLQLAFNKIEKRQSSIYQNTTNSEKQPRDQKGEERRLSQLQLLLKFTDMS